MGRGGGVHERNAYSFVLRTHPLPSFNINELGFSQSSCFLACFKGAEQQDFVDRRRAHADDVEIVKGIA